ncbi:hypothetical protein SDC9_37568 [bioreactor metagenome]|jgi:thiol-disulfide isomerase/thioredoxin|uniref:Thioredoxin-like fold domain-containing protein n=1 Tax=bioreactor metagenome TaxID=1076179 RepID=A0A644VJS8_9ZZZZ|nr:hypothetical protein [Bacteroidaceae bacterium]MEA5099071.1 hypothetical protein [Bacteroidales bacterium]
MFNIKAILLLLIFIVLLLSCEHKKNNNILIPNKISVCKLVEYINSDTNNYKVIYIYNPYCKPCEDQFRFLIETSKQNENNRVKYYLISESRDWKFIDTSLNYFFLEENVVLLNINDTNSEFTKNNADWINNIVNKVIREDSINIHGGTPQTLILSKNSQLLKSLWKTDSNSLITPTSISDIYGQDLSKIDFSKIIQLNNN